MASCVPNSDARGEVALLAILGYFEGDAKYIYIIIIIDLAPTFLMVLRKFDLSALPRDLLPAHFFTVLPAF